MQLVVRAQARATAEPENQHVPPSQCRSVDTNARRMPRVIWHSSTNTLPWRFAPPISLLTEL